MSTDMLRRLTNCRLLLLLLEGGEGKMGACTHWNFQKSAPMYSCTMATVNVKGSIVGLLSILPTISTMRCEERWPRPL